MSSPNTNYKKILVLQTAFLGDVILSTPLIRALKEVFPDSKLDVLTIPETSIIFQENPHINEIINFNKRKLRTRIPSFFRVVSQIRKKRYDLAISIQTSFTSALLMLLGRVPVRLGFPRQKLLNLTISLQKGIPIVKRTLLLMQPFSDKKFNIQTELFWNLNTKEKATQIIEKIRKDNQPVIGIAPGSVWKTKRWLKEYFVTLVKLLEVENVDIVFIGGKEDNHLCAEIIESADSRASNLAGTLNVLESAALIEKLDLMITNDSAPLHLANAVQTDVLAIFGPTVRRFGFFPFRENDIVMEVDLYCRPCGKHGGNSCPEKHFKCMKEIRPEMVFEKVLYKFNSVQHE